MNTKASTRLLDVKVTVANGRRDGHFCLVQDHLQTDSWIYSGIPVCGMQDMQPRVHTQAIVQLTPDLSERAVRRDLN